jgi:hypothetical protein
MQKKDQLILIILLHSNTQIKTLSKRRNVIKPSQTVHIPYTSIKGQ